MISVTWILRFTRLVLGLIFYGIGIGFLLKASIGVPPWDVFAQGFSNKTGLSYGWAVNLISVAVLLFWIPLRQRFGLGTVLNAFILGHVADFTQKHIPQLEFIWQQIGLFSAGIIIIAIATGLYIGSNFGAGPRDGLMTGLNQRTGWKIWKIRSGIEISVCIIGWLLGGNLGLGTIAFAVFIGPLCGISLKWLAPSTIRTELKSELNS